MRLMKQVPLDPESQFIELLAKFDEALATASNASSVSSQPFVSTLADADFQQRFDRVQSCLQLLDQDRRRQAATSASGRREETPRQIGRFRVIRRLGSGGFGVVFLAEDPMLRRPVAIKMPLATIFQSQELHDRFLRECRAAAMLNHPGIVRVLESGDVHGIPYQVAEFVDGERLSDLVKRQRPSVVSAAKIVRSLADAVQHAHDHGVLHRDLKPDNILLQNPVGVAWNANSDFQSTESTRSPDAALQEQARQQTPIQAALVPRITDFGLARVADDDAALSRSGMLVGTPKYMSPEQLNGKVRLQGPATDIYSLGVVLHELLTGAVPFADADSLQSRIVASENSVPSFRSARADVSKDLETICLKCLRLRPEDRYCSAGELRDDLSRYLDGRPTLARPVPIHEQFYRWVAGNRKRSALLGMLTLLVLVVFVQAIRNERASYKQSTMLSMTVKQLMAEKQRADDSLQQANASRIEAVQSESRYRDVAWLAQQGEYSAAMMQASEAWQRGDIALMNQVLLPFLSWHDDELRGFAWRYLWGQGQSLRPLIGHSEFVCALSITNDGERAWSIGEDNTIRRWHLNSGVLESTWKLAGEGHRIQAAFSKDCRRAVIAKIVDRAVMSDVTVCDPESNRVLMHRSFPDDNINAVAISNDGNAVVVAGNSQSTTNASVPFIQIWLPDTDTVINDDSSFRTLLAGEATVPGRSISSIRFSPDGTNLMVAVTDAFSPAHSHVLMTSLGTVALEDASKSEMAFGPLTPIRWSRGRVHHMVFSPDGRYLAMTLIGDLFWAEIWDLKTGEMVRATEEFSRPINAISFDSTGTNLGLGLTLAELDSALNATMPIKETVQQTRYEFRLWDFAADTSQTLPYQAKRDIPFLKPLKSDAGAGWIVGHGGGALNIWRPEVVAPYHEFIGHRPTEVWDLALSSDGSTLFSVGDDHFLRSWDVATSTEKNSSSPRSILVSCVAVSPDGRWVAAGGYDDEIVVYDKESLNPVATLSGHTHDLRALAFSPDSRMLATGGRDKIIRLWNVPNFSEAGIREGHQDTVRALTWTTDGQLVSSGSDRRILVWDANGHIVRERTEPEGVHSLAFAPAGLRVPVPGTNAVAASVEFRSPTATDAEATNTQRIVTVQANELLALGMKHGTVRLWHIPTDTVFFEAVNHGVEIRSLAFSPDGGKLAVGGDDGAVSLWHVPSGRKVLAFDQLGSSVNRVAFSPDGSRLFAALHDGTIRTWYAPHLTPR